MENLRETSTQLNHAVQGLNELMEEALRIAGQAAHNGRPDEIAAIFDDATAHLRHAQVSQKQPRRRHHSTDDLRHGQPESPRILPSAVLPVGRSRRARPRVDDPTELHHLGLPLPLKQYLRDRVVRNAQPVPPEPSARPTPNVIPESSTTSYGTSNATTISPEDIDLKHPRKRHISLRPGQDISLGRHHHRQPIAREWPTGRKRITAMIACLNTIFIGLIVGIYVSVMYGSFQESS